MRAVLTPTNLQELFSMLEQYPAALPIAGGTDLLVLLRQNGLRDRRPLLSLAEIQELQGIREKGGTLSIGAASTFSRIIADPLIAEHAPLLARAASTIGGPAIRNMATLGGNICTASPAGDSLTPLHVLAAKVEIASPAAKRIMPIEHFIVGPGRTALREGEILTRILLPRYASFPDYGFEKIGRRRAMAIAVTSFAGLVRRAADGTIETARFAWGSVGPTVVRIPSLEQALVGAKLDADYLCQVAQIVASRVAPISDVRATADYRRMLAANLTVRFLEGLLD
ncbi:FAD binding domain-containing protein [uncultured Thiodictyon sp.]|uniref:FAD binding domain-containing protein n=1 Tax=uncultured Thiodictyon sp. TaxID=1846217 RepID=UPI0025E0929C|nr:FAD binding domain-containing protein [uncultured Thiodictyon sp.]